MVQAAGAPPAPPATPPGALDYEVFKARVEPLLLEKRPGHARCVPLDRYRVPVAGLVARLQHVDR